MKNKILFSMFLGVLVLVSFVGAEELIISNITDSNYTLPELLDKEIFNITIINSTYPNNSNITITPFNITNQTLPIPEEPSIKQPPIFIGLPVIPYIKVGDSHTFRVQVSDPDGDPIAIEWYLEDILVSTTDSYNFTPTSVGTYNFKIIASDGKSNNSFEFNVQVHPKIIIIPKDTTPPIISNVRTTQICDIGGDICGPLFVIWDTNEPSHFNKVEYGKGKQYDYSVSQDYYYTNLTIVPKPALAIDLGKSGTYHYKVTSCDLSGNCATSKSYKVKGRITKNPKKPIFL